MVIVLSVGISLYCLDHYFLQKCLHYADPSFHCSQIQMSSKGLLSSCKHRKMIASIFRNVYADALLKDRHSFEQDYGPVCLVTVKDAAVMFSI